ncbi:PAS domain S-box protein [Pseudodesulfovibrio sp.]|nr:PAS domain S-box protein [Pseudodesulfovibrio sp.]
MKCCDLLYPTHLLDHIDDLNAFKTVLKKGNDRLGDMFLVRLQNYTGILPVPPHTALWQQWLPDFTTALIQTIDSLAQPQIIPKTSGRDLPIVNFAVDAGKDRLGSVRMVECLSIFKHLRATYLDYASEVMDSEHEHTTAIEYIDTCFDACEVALCCAWDHRQHDSSVTLAKSQAERFFGAIFDNASAGIAIITPEGVVALANAHCAEQTGYAPEELAGKNFSVFSHPDELELIKTNVGRLISGEIDSMRRERRLLRKDGTTLYMDISTAAIRDEAGALEYLVVVMADTNERREAEQALDRSERLFRGVFDNASIGIALVSNQGTLMSANAKCCDISGYSNQEIVGSSATKYYTSNDLPTIEGNLQKLLAGDIQSIRNEWPLLRKDGSRLWVDQNTSAIPDDDGNVEALIVTFTDIQERKLAEDQLRENERELRRYRELMRGIMDGIPMLMGYVDTDLRYKYVNSYYKKLYNIDPIDVIGKRVPDLIGDAVFAKVKPHYTTAMGGEIARFDLLFDSPKRGPRHLDVSYIPHVFDGVTEGIIILIQDATDRKLAVQERDRFFDVSLDMFFVSGFDGYFRQTNPACTAILGWSAEKFRSRKVIRFVHPEDVRMTQEKLAAMANGTIIEAFENRVRCKDGSYRWITWNSLPLYEEQLIYSIGHDTTHRHEMEEQLRAMATIDPLTQAMNRRHFFSQGGIEFTKAKRYGYTVSVFMLDIDHFKTVNDTYGHMAGDQVLQDMAAVCQNVLREGDLFCRYGGEEFTGILMEADAESAQATARRLLEGLASHVSKTDVGEIAITASIGTATLADEDESLQDLLNRADTALYAAKKKGRNCSVHL